MPRFGRYDEENQQKSQFPQLQNHKTKAKKNPVFRYSNNLLWNQKTVNPSLQMAWRQLMENVKDCMHLCFLDRVESNLLPSSVFLKLTWEIFCPIIKMSVYNQIRGLEPSQVMGINYWQTLLLVPNENFSLSSKVRETPTYNFFPYLAVCEIIWGQLTRI